MVRTNLGTFEMKTDIESRCFDPQLVMIEMFIVLSIDLIDSVFFYASRREDRDFS